MTAPLPGFSAIILAAGRSSRMRREKSRLPWLEGKPLLTWMVDALTAAGWQTTAVVGPETLPYWTSALPPGCTVLNPDPSRGKTSSLACGARRLPKETDWILITSVDQPRMPSLYRSLRLEATERAAKIIVPGRQGSRGHPVVLAGTLREAFLSLDESTQGLRGLLDAHRSETYRLPHSDSAESQWDMNTPDEYEKALTFFRQHTNKN